MKVDEVLELVAEFNQSGQHRTAWFYFPAHYRNDEWFVARRPKSSKIVVAVFVDGRRSILETSA